MPYKYTPWKRVPPQLSCRLPLCTERLQRSLPRSFSSPGWSSPAPTTCHHSRGTPTLWSSVWCFSGHTSAAPHPSCAGVPDLDAMLQTGPRKGIAEQNNHLPRHDVHTSFDTFWFRSIIRRTVTSKLNKAASWNFPFQEIQTGLHKIFFRLLAVILLIYSKEQEWSFCSLWELLMYCTENPPSGTEDFHKTVLLRWRKTEVKDFTLFQQNKPARCSQKISQKMEI